MQNQNVAQRWGSMELIKYECSWFQSTKAYGVIYKTKQSLFPLKNILRFL
jgi:hypothetical protein